MLPINLALYYTVPDVRRVQPQCRCPEDKAFPETCTLIIERPKHRKGQQITCQIPVRPRRLQILDRHKMANAHPCPFRTGGSRA